MARSLLKVTLSLAVVGLLSGCKGGGGTGTGAGTTDNGNKPPARCSTVGSNTLIATLGDTTVYTSVHIANDKVRIYAIKNGVAQLVSGIPEASAYTLVSSGNAVYIVGTGLSDKGFQKQDQLYVIDNTGTGKNISFPDSASVSLTPPVAVGDHAYVGRGDFIYFIDPKKSEAEKINSELNSISMNRSLGTKGDYDYITGDGSGIYAIQNSASKKNVSNIDISNYMYRIDSGVTTDENIFVVGRQPGSIVAYNIVGINISQMKSKKIKQTSNDFSTISSVGDSAYIFEYGDSSLKLMNFYSIGKDGTATNILDTVLSLKNSLYIWGPVSMGNLLYFAVKTTDGQNSFYSFNPSSSSLTNIGQIDSSGTITPRYNHSFIFDNNRMYVKLSGGALGTNLYAITQGKAVKMDLPGTSNVFKGNTYDYAFSVNGKNLYAIDVNHQAKDVKMDNIYNGVFAGSFVYGISDNKIEFIDEKNIGGNASPQAVVGIPSSCQ